MEYMQDIMNRRIVLMLRYMKQDIFYVWGKWEDGIKTTMKSQGRRDTLAIDDPMEYARLALEEEMQAWVDAMDDYSVW